MSGNNSNLISNGINMTNEELHAMIVDERERDEFGFYEFQNPFVQKPFQEAQKEYRLKLNLKTAYEKQEFLRKMRADIKREYLTRKKQLKKLQQDAAVTFREDEMKLQEHYSTEFAKSQPRREIDIHAPLVSRVVLPEGKCMNIKEFNIDQAFEGLRGLYREYYQSEREAVIEFAIDAEQQHLLQMKREEQEQAQEQAQEINATPSWSEWMKENNEESEPAEEWKKYISYTPEEQKIISNCDAILQEYYDAISNEDFWHAERLKSCFIIPARELRKRKECEARQAAAAEEEAQEISRRWLTWEEISPEKDERMWLENMRDDNDPCIQDDNDSDIDIDIDMHFIEEEEQPCDEVIAPASAPVSASAPASAQSTKKSKAAAKRKAKKAAAKAKKQQQNGNCNSNSNCNNCKKFTPFEITMNDNRSRYQQDQETSTLLTASKLEINLPKKNLQNASREAIKRHNQKWKQINAEAKQSGARGTKIPMLPEDLAWAKYYGYDSE